KGSNAWHGSVFSYFETDAMDSRASTFSRYDPNSAAVPAAPPPRAGGRPPPPLPQYVPKKKKNNDNFPHLTPAGPIWKDHIFGFVAFNPEFNQLERGVNYALSQDPTLVPLGQVKFSQNTQTYYTNARIDAAVTKKLRVYASWLYQLQHLTGELLPFQDSSNGLYNVSASINPSNFNHGLGYVSPNVTTNIGADFN